MTVFTASNIDSLNQAMRANKNVMLGDILAGLVSASGTLVTDVATLKLEASGSNTLLKSSGCYVAVADDASNAKMAVATGIPAIVGYVANVRRSGSPLTNMNVYAGSVAGTLCVKKDPTTAGSSIAAGDVLAWFAF